MLTVQQIVDRFGGLSAMARALGHEFPSRVQGWRDRNVIPAQQQSAVLRAAKERGIPLEATDLIEAA